MKYSKSDKSYARNQINTMLMNVLGVPKKYVGGSSFAGYWSLLNKWIYKDKYDLQYIYFVVNIINTKCLKTSMEITAGFLEGALRSKIYINSFNPEEHMLPSGGNREDLLMAGHTVETLPLHLLTREERKQRKQGPQVSGNVTAEDRQSLTNLLKNGGAVAGK